MIRQNLTATFWPLDVFFYFEHSWVIAFLYRFNSNPRHVRLKRYALFKTTSISPSMNMSVNRKAIDQYFTSYKILFLTVHLILFGCLVWFINNYFPRSFNRIILHISDETISFDKADLLDGFCLFGRNFIEIFYISLLLPVIFGMVYFAYYMAYRFNSKNWCLTIFWLSYLKRSKFFTLITNTIQFYTNLLILEQRDAPIKIEV